MNHVQFMTRMNIVDDSQLAKDGMNYRRAPKIIHVYNKKRIGTIGDKILLAVKGQKQKAIIVGCKNYYRKDGKPNFDTNNCVLVDDQDTPFGSRITVPIPSSLRGNSNCSKLIALAGKFV
jgi:large subunit ribosomal protein L14